jgi:hypothetical protein
MKQYKLHNGKTLNLRLTSRMHDALNCLMNTWGRTLWMDCDVAKSLERTGLGMIWGVRGLDKDELYKVRLTRDAEALCWQHLLNEWQRKDLMASDSAARINAQRCEF